MSFELPSVTELEKMINALSDKEFNQIRTEYSAEVFYQEMKELQKRINKMYSNTITHNYITNSESSLDNKNFDSKNITPTNVDPLKESISTIKKNMQFNRKNDIFANSTTFVSSGFRKKTSLKLNEKGKAA